MTNSDAEPRLVAIHRHLLLNGTGRQHRWSIAEVGMTVTQLRDRGISLHEQRHLAERGVAVFDRPLPPRIAPARRRPYHRPARKERSVALPRLDEAKPTRPRPCITCGKTFASEGAHNRMCDYCRATTTADPAITVG